MTYLSIQEILNLYPNLPWSKVGLIDLYDGKVLIGKMAGNVLFIEKNSLERLVQYHKKVQEQ